MTGKIVDGDDAAHRDGIAWYHAAVATGDLWLGVPRALQPIERPARRLLHDALRLADAEPLLATLEAWLGEALDPAPCDAPTQPAGLLAEVVHGVAAPAGTRCWLPIEPLRARSAPASMRGDDLHWQALRLDVELDRFDLPASERAKLAVGRVLLLPGSFATNWRALLFDDARGLCCRARVSNDLRDLLLDAEDATERSGELRVRLLAKARLNPGALLGWPAAPDRIELEGLANGEAGYAQLEAAGPGGRALALGRIVPALAGYALKIESI